MSPIHVLATELTRHIREAAPPTISLMWPPVTRRQWRAVSHVVGMSSYPHRGSWFGGLYEVLVRALLGRRSRITERVRLAGYDPDLARRLLHNKLGSAGNIRQCPLRLALLGFLVQNAGATIDSLLNTAPHPNGQLWQLNRLLPLDAKRWMGVQLSWRGTPLCTTLADALDDDLKMARRWSMTGAPTVYNCDPEDLPSILIETAGFWQAFFDALDGKGWGNSQAGSYVNEQV